MISKQNLKQIKFGGVGEWVEVTSNDSDYTIEPSHP